MSVMKDPYLAPSRVKGVVRFLQQAKGQSEKRETLEVLLSPTNLISKGDDKKVSRNMIQATVRECIKMGLLTENEEGSEVKLSQSLNLDESLLSYVLAQLLLNTPNYTENHDLAKVIAWFLAQDFFTAPGTWPAVEKRLREQIGAELLELNDARYGQFRDWSCYLGFGWLNSLSGDQILVPDPTAYLRLSLARIFEDLENQQVLMGDFINRLGKNCPVLEAGLFREDLEAQLGGRDPNYVSSTTSIALRRLQDEGLIKLEKLSDTTVWILQDGDKSRISHITYLNEASHGGSV